MHNCDEMILLNYKRLRYMSPCIGQAGLYLSALAIRLPPLALFQQSFVNLPNAFLMADPPSRITLRVERRD